MQKSIQRSHLNRAQYFYDQYMNNGKVSKKILFDTHPWLLSKRIDRMVASSGINPIQPGAKDLFGDDLYAPTVDAVIYTGRNGGPWDYGPDSSDKGWWDGLLMNHFAYDLHSSGLYSQESPEYWRDFTLDQLKTSAILNCQADDARIFGIAVGETANGLMGVNIIARDYLMPVPPNFKLSELEGKEAYFRSLPNLRLGRHKCLL